MRRVLSTGIGLVVGQISNTWPVAREVSRVTLPLPHSTLPFCSSLIFVVRSFTTLSKRSRQHKIIWIDGELDYCKVGWTGRRKWRRTPNGIADFCLKHAWHCFAYQNKAKITDKCYIHFPFLPFFFPFLPFHPCLLYLLLSLASIFFWIFCPFIFQLPHHHYWLVLQLRGPIQEESSQHK